MKKLFPVLAALICFIFSIPLRGMADSLTLTDEERETYLKDGCSMVLKIYNSSYTYYFSEGGAIRELPFSEHLMVTSYLNIPDDPSAEILRTWPHLKTGTLNFWPMISDAFFIEYYDKGKELIKTSDDINVL